LWDEEDPSFLGRKKARFLALCVPGLRQVWLLVKTPGEIKEI